MKPAWIIEAEKHIGLKEIPGPGNQPVIANWLVKLNAWWTNDADPWCGVFAGWCMKQAGIEYPKAYYRAKAWLDWGVPTLGPSYGCVVIFNRVGGGHVGFVVGIDRLGRLMVLGGNQRDMVRILPFDLDRVAGYRMPYGFIASREPLPILDSGAASSLNEA